MIELNANIGSLSPRIDTTSIGAGKVDKADGQKVDFAEAAKGINKYISGVNDLQQASDESMLELLSGKNTDINSVVAAVAKADMSFKLLVGVRNKLIEAYKQTMNMQI